ncbi:antibiotic biosynthesis monooxygenase [Kitasatospora sp. NPDC002227]|uniref:antibiotic biosynthesis monooxygenase n=1 Tax=Kitasatospora sp. NPDC002227 TaxID=3154773 RepID=UPI00331C3440
MYVRTIYLTGDPGLVDKTVDGLKADAVGLLSARPGYRGFSIFTNRELGTIMLGSWWETEEAERDSFAALTERRDELLGVFEGTVTVDVWEAASAQRGTAAAGGFRLVRLEFDPAGADRLVSSYQDRAVPGLGSIDGFVGGALLINRAAGQGSVGALFRDRAALEASRGPQAAIRAKASVAAGVRVRSLEEFDVALLDRPA